MTKKIVLVDDNQIVLDLHSIMLGQMSGVEVVLFTKAKDALVYVGKHPVDLVITDLMMPEMNGLTFITELKKLNPAVKIVAISGDGVLASEHHLLDEALNLGATYIMAKPYSMHALQAKIMQALNA